jgi:hypothetical protein
MTKRASPHSATDGSAITKRRISGNIEIASLEVKHSRPEIRAGSAPPQSPAAGWRPKPNAKLSRSSANPFGVADFSGIKALPQKKIRIEREAAPAPAPARSLTPSRAFNPNRNGPKPAPLKPTRYPGTGLSNVSGFVKQGGEARKGAIIKAEARKDVTVPKSSLRKKTPAPTKFDSDSSDDGREIDFDWGLLDNKRAQTDDYGPLATKKRMTFNSRCAAFSSSPYVESLITSFTADAVSSPCDESGWAINSDLVKASPLTITPLTLTPVSTASPSPSQSAIKSLSPSYTSACTSTTSSPISESTKEEAPTDVTVALVATSDTTLSLNKAALIPGLQKACFPPLPPKKGISQKKVLLNADWICYKDTKFSVAVGDLVIRHADGVIDGPWRITEFNAAVQATDPKLANDDGYLSSLLLLTNRD